MVKNLRPVPACPYCETSLMRAHSAVLCIGCGRSWLLPAPVAVVVKLKKGGCEICGRQKEKEVHELCPRCARKLRIRQDGSGNKTLDDGRVLPSGYYASLGQSTNILN